MVRLICISVMGGRVKEDAGDADQNEWDEQEFHCVCASTNGTILGPNAARVQGYQPPNALAIGHMYYSIGPRTKRAGD